MLNDEDFGWNIHEGDEIINEWYKQARDVKNSDELKEFIDYVYNSGSPDYGACVHAVTAIAIAASWCANKQYGLTGFQASFVGLEYLVHWTYEYDKPIALKITNFNDMLNPRCQPKFEKRISPEIFALLQEKAKENLEEGRGTDLAKEHWQSIVDGEVPFGYTIIEDNCIA